MEILPVDMDRPLSSPASDAPTRIDRRNDPFRRKVQAAIDLQHHGWITGRDGGRPWTLSRSKRLTSAVLAALLLVALSPVLLVVALTI